MSAAGRYCYHRFSGRPEGFGEDASFQRGGTGAARWRWHREQRPAPASAAPPSERARRFGLAMVILAVLLCILVLLEALRLHMHRAGRSGATDNTHHVARRLVYPASVHRQCLLVPESAVQVTSTGSFVVVVDADNIAHLRTVKVGNRALGDVEVLEGLDSQESILASFPEGIQEGERVQPQ